MRNKWLARLFWRAGGGVRCGDGGLFYLFFWIRRGCSITTITTITIAVMITITILITVNVVAIAITITAT